MCYDSIKSDATGIYPLAVAVAAYIKKIQSKEESKSQNHRQASTNVINFIISLYFLFCAHVCVSLVFVHMFIQIHINCACTEAR